jgi:hypothetical protein
MKRLSIFLAALLISGSAMGASIEDRLRVERKLDLICRANGPESPEGKYACRVRDNIVRSLYEEGLCYGKNSQVGADHQWHVCTKNSIRLGAF